MPRRRRFVTPNHYPRSYTNEDYTPVPAAVPVQSGAVSAHPLNEAAKFVSPLVSDDERAKTPDAPECYLECYPTPEDEARSRTRSPSPSPVGEWSHQRDLQTPSSRIALSVATPGDTPQSTPMKLEPEYAAHQIYVQGAEELDWMDSQESSEQEDTEYELTLRAPVVKPLSPFGQLQPPSTREIEAVATYRSVSPGSERGCFVSSRDRSPSPDSSDQESSLSRPSSGLAKSPPVPVPIGLPTPRSMVTIVPQPFLNLPEPPRSYSNSPESPESPRPNRDRLSPLCTLDEEDEEVPFPRPASVSVMEESPRAVSPAQLPKIHDRSDKFYFDERNTIVILLSSQLFRVHRDWLSRYCKTFQDLFGSEEPSRGTSDEDPLILDNLVVSGLDLNPHALNADNFQLCLRLLYPDQALDFPPESKSEWISVLEVSRLLQSSFLRKTAIKNLDLSKELKSDSNLMLQLAVRHGIEEWLPEVFRKLCTRAKPLQLEQLTLLPVAQANNILRAREDFRRWIVTKSGTNCHRQFAVGGAPLLECASKALQSIRHVVGNQPSRAYEQNDSGDGCVDVDLIRLVREQDWTDLCQDCKAGKGAWLRTMEDTVDSMLEGEYEDSGPAPLSRAASVAGSARSVRTGFTGF